MRPVKIIVNFTRSFDVLVISELVWALRSK